MPRICKICVHPRVSEINQMLVGSEAYRSVAKHFGVSESGVYRHQEHHLPTALIKAKDAAEIIASDGLMAKVAELEAAARRIAATAETAGELKTALTGIRELVRITELLAKLTGQLGDRRASSCEGRPHVTFNFPVLSEEDLKAIENAPVIDLPPAAKRLLQRPSDGKPL